MVHRLTATDAAARIRARELSAETLVRACLDRIAAREETVGAWTYLDADAALEAARRSDRVAPAGPLHGVPIAVKDIIDTHDMPTGLGFAPYAARRPVWDAACVAACRQAGAIVLGKTVTTEFAYFKAGKTRHPHDPQATPGGSSSGSAAAVADFMAPLAFGSQTAASLIRPAAFCGVAGYKASHGEFALSGIRPFAESFDSLGVLARSVQDLALMRRVLQGGDAPAATGDGPTNAPRLAFYRSEQWPALEPAARVALEDVVARLAAQGACCDEIDPPPSFLPVVEAHRTVMAYEAARNYRHERRCHEHELSEAFHQLCDVGERLSRDDYLAARHGMAIAKQEFDRLFAGYDAWVAPSALGEAPPAVSGTGDPIMSRLWTALHAPCVALLIGRGARTLPLGMQLVAPQGHDARLLDVAIWVEDRTRLSSN